MALSILGLAGIKLYLALLIAMIIVGGGAYTVLDLGAEPYALSDDEDDTFDIDYIEAGQSSMAFTSTPSGASVIIDSDTYTTPTGDIDLNPGAYEYVVTLTDYEGRVALANVEDGKAITLNIALAPVEVESTPDPDATETPTPDGTPDPDATATPIPDGTETATATATPSYEIPFAGIDVRVRAATPFQGVALTGGYDEGEWLAVQGKRLLITDDNVLTLHQVSGYPNGVGDTAIDYTDEVSTSYMEFESAWTWGSNVDFTLTHTGSSDVGFIGSPVSGSFPAPEANNALWEIGVVPVTYGFAFDVVKRVDAAPIIKDNIAEPVGIVSGEWEMASLGSWDPFRDPVIIVYADGTSGSGGNDYDIMNWMFWGPDVVNSAGDWIVGDASSKVVVRANKVIDYTTPGAKTMYVTLIDHHEIGTGDGTIPYMSEYKITYTLGVGGITNTKVTEI